MLTFLVQVSPYSPSLRPSTLLLSGCPFGYTCIAAAVETLLKWRCVAATDLWKVNPGLLPYTLNINKAMTGCRLPARHMSSRTLTWRRARWMRLSRFC